MAEKKADTQADADRPDRGEPITLMEPLLIPEGARQRGALVDRALTLAQKAASLRSALPASLLAALATLVRSMNCYYSNLIEGHDTHPIDIERALQQDYSADPHQRDLQLEAQAHIAVQRWIDQGGLQGRALTIEGLREIHRRFCEQIPDDLLWVKTRKGGAPERVIPGAWRTRDVEVGRHVAISAGAIPRFLNRFESAYGNLGPTNAILAAACAHHRLLWVHPFTDGNGRVARLMSHATLLETLDTGAVWSVARGLARNAETYKRHLAACDQPRRNDLDGRGHLSQEALADFTAFFLDVCIDQVDFMEGLIQPEQLRTRIQSWTEDAIRQGTLPARADALLGALLYRGTLPRREVPAILGVSERQARRVLSALTSEGVITAETTRAPLQLAFPARLASRWMPGLFPEQAAR